MSMRYLRSYLTHLPFALFAKRYFFVVVSVNVVGREVTALLAGYVQVECKAYELVQETQRWAQQIQQESI